MAETKIANMPGGSVDDPLFMSAVGRTDVKTDTTDVIDCIADVSVTQADLEWEVYPDMKIPFPHPVLYLTGEVTKLSPADPKASFPCGVKSLSYGSAAPVDELSGDVDDPALSSTRPAVRYRYMMTPAEFSTLVERGLGADRQFDWPEPNVLLNDYTLPMKCQFTYVQPKGENVPPVLFANIIDATCIDTSAEDADYEPLANYFTPSPGLSVSPKVEADYKQARERYDAARLKLDKLMTSLDGVSDDDAERQLRQARNEYDAANRGLQTAEATYNDATSARNRVQPDVTAEEQAREDAFVTTSDEMISDRLFADEDDEPETAAAPETPVEDAAPEAEAPAKAPEAGGATKSKSERAERQVASSLQNFDVNGFDFFGTPEDAGSAPDGVVDDDLFADEDDGLELDGKGKNSKVKSSARRTQSVEAAEELIHEENHAGSAQTYSDALFN